jgi:DNA-binding GntR family transcriptional regulator
MDPSLHWATPPVSSRQPAAIARYEAGVAALVADAPHGALLFEEALDLDPHFALARVAHAVALVLQGAPFARPDVGPPLTRGERQHLEVIRAVVDGDAERANDLRREHLAEFPGDLLVVWLPAALAARHRTAS